MTARWRSLLIGIVALMAAGPLALVVVQSFADRWTGRSLIPQQLGGRGWTTVTGDALLVQAVANSALIALLAVSVAIPLGYGAARGVTLARGRTRIGLLVVLLAPLIVPQLAVGAGLATWLLRIGLADSIIGVVSAHSLYVVPYVMLAIIPGFDARLIEHEQAASTLGASRTLRLRTVTIPALRSNLALAGAIGFVVSWSQFGTSLTVGGGMPLLPLVVMPFVRADPQVGAALTVVLLVPAVFVAAAAATTTRWGGITQLGRSSP